MSKLAKKFATIATVITVLAMVIGPVAPAQALTTAELQAQIATLQATLAALTAQMGTATPATPGVLPAGCTFARALKLGMSGADVKCLQQVLNADPATQVAVSGVGAPGAETLYFGAKTKVAVSKYQVKQGIVAVGTGFVGTLTLAKLNGGAVPVVPGTVVPGAVVVNGVVTASLASDNPVSASIVSDAGGSQSIIPMLKVNLSNGTASEIKVTSIKFLRSGISADSDLSQAYIYDGDTKLAEYNSFSSSVLTFTNSAGVVTIPANSVKAITLKVDLANGIAAGKTIGFSINAVTDIVSNASSIGGTFPITGNNMSTALVTDLGELDVTMVATPATPDPGTGVEVMKFTLAGTNQKIELRKLIFSNIGTVAYTDLTNFQLLDGATVVGSVVASANSDKTVVMNLATPLVIDKGITKTMTLKADVVAGTARTYRFSFQNMSDVVVYDAQYKVYIKPNQSDSWTIVNGTEATIQSGKVTVSRSTESPQGNISSGATNVVLAKYKIKASGEDVKITALTLKIYGTIAAVGMYQTAVYYDGAQIGQTTTTMNSGATAGATDGTIFSFGNTFVLPAGVEKVIEIRSDIKTSAGGTITAGSTLTGQISSFTATGKTSSATVTIGSVTGYQLTVSAGTLAVTKNQAVPSWTATVPTGVAGGVNVLIGSFILTAGSGEGANITGISAQVASTSVPGTANTEFQNVRIFKGTYASGVQLGSALNSGGTPTASTTYTTYPSPYLALAKGEQVTLNVYADILTGADTNNIRQVVIGPVYGTGLITNTSVDSSGWISGQDAVVSAGGYVGAAIDTNTPVAGLVVAGTTGIELARWKLSASSSPEAMSVTGLIATTTLTTATVSSISNLALSATIDGVASSWTGVALTGLAANARADFGSLMTVNPLVIPAGKEAIVSLKATIASWPTAPSGGVVTFALASTTWKGEGDPTSVTVYAVGNAQTMYKSKPTVTVLTSAEVPATGGVSMGTFSDGTQTLIKFRVAADAKGAIDLNRVNIKVAINDIATSTSNLYLSGISLYAIGDSTVLNDMVIINASTTATYADYSASSTVALSKFGGALTGDPLSKTGNILLTNLSEAALIEIGANSYIDFEVKATVTGSAQYDTMTFSLDNFSTAAGGKNAILWGDTTASTILPSTYVKTIPTNTWSYTR